MDKTNGYECWFSDGDDNNHVICIDKSLHHQYLSSLESDSNMSTKILLDNMWQKHVGLFETRVLPQVSQSINDLIKNSKVHNQREWESNPMTYNNAVALFEKSISPCEQCKEFVPNTGLEILKNITNNCTSKKDKTIKHFINERQNPTPNRNNQADFGMFDVNESTNVFKPRQSKSKPQNSFADGEKVFIERDAEEDRKAHNSSVAKITFKTAREQLLGSNPGAKRSLGASRKAQNKFVSPMIGAQDKQESNEPVITDDRLKHLDPKMVELIESEIIDKGSPVAWEDIAGLQMAKSVIQEAVVWPLLRPDIFTGLRRPPKGILLFGPPGTGKTLIGKCVAAQCKATFFSISASSLTSKWIGDGEKMVRALFAVARVHQPAVIFIDEIDSLLTQRSDSEHEATRRIKTEFLVQFDGAATAEEDRILIVGATNRPQELDEAARRRLVKRLYIPLPDADARRQIISNLLSSERHTLNAADVEEVSRRTHGYSGADMKSLCSEAAMGPIRSVPLDQIVSIQRDSVRPVSVQDFVSALQRVRPSVSQDDLGQYVKWNQTYGQGF